MKEKDKAKSNKKLTLKKTIIRDLTAKEGAKIKGGIAITPIGMVKGGLTPPTCQTTMNH